MAISSCSTSNVPSFSVEQEDFYFVLTWGVGLDSSYDSRTGTLIKTKYVVERQPEEYIAIYQYPNINEIYEMAKSINVYSYADHYYPYEGSLIMTSPSVNYVFEINDKTITSNDCPILNEIPDEAIKNESLKYLEKMENSEDGETFNINYSKLLSTIANFITIITPIVTLISSYINC